MEQKVYTMQTLPAGASLQARQAAALTALEVSHALSVQIAGEAVAMGAFAAESEQAAEFEKMVLERLRLDGRLSKQHITYPRVSWRGSVTFPEDVIVEGFPILLWSVEIFTDSIRSFRVEPIPVGGGPIASGLTAEFSQERTAKPDEIRRRFNLPIYCKAMLNGQTLTVQLPSDTAFSEGGHPTAAARRMAELERQQRPIVQGRHPVAPVAPSTGVAVPGPGRPRELPASELLADESGPGAGGLSPSIGKQPPASEAAIGKAPKGGRR